MKHLLLTIFSIALLVAGSGVTAAESSAYRGHSTGDNDRGWIQAGADRSGDSDKYYGVGKKVRDAQTL